VHMFFFVLGWYSLFVCLFVVLTTLRRCESSGRASGGTGAASPGNTGINQSLLALGRVITALVDHHGHIPYRDSKLTRLLQESLGGKAKTRFIATISPSHMQADDTVAALECMLAARNIRNQPVANTNFKQKSVMRDSLKEIETLRAQLHQAREKNGVYVDPEYFYDAEVQLKQTQLQLQECQEALKLRDNKMRIMRLEKEEAEEKLREANRDLASTDTLLEELKQDSERARDREQALEEELAAVKASLAARQQAAAQSQQQSLELHQEVSRSHADMNRLREKMEQVAFLEAQTLQETDAFISHLGANNQKISLRIQELSRQSQEHSAALESGVGQMLQQGRETCASLKAAIGAALVTMIGDAERARDEMTESCGSLKFNLHTTNTQLDTTLRVLQDQLTDWLDTVEECILGTQSLIESHKGQVQPYARAFLCVVCLCS
jgi:kinesin family member 11